MEKSRVAEMLLKRWMMRHAPLVATSASAAGAGRPSKVTRRELDTELVYGSGSCAVGRIRNALRSGRLPCPSGIISTSPAPQTSRVNLARTDTARPLSPGTNEHLLTAKVLAHLHPQEGLTIMEL
jgi:hypothetical protein